MKASQEQYKKRANYAKSKFNEVKEKLAESTPKDEGVYRLKNTQLKAQMKKVQEELEATGKERDELKLKVVQMQQNNKFREEYERAQRQIQRLEGKLRQYELEEERRNSQVEMQQLIETALRKEGQGQEGGEDEGDQNIGTEEKVK